MTDFTDLSNPGTMGAVAVTPSARSLMTFDPQQAAMANFVRTPQAPQPVSVNAWTHQFDQIQTGTILGNIVV